MSKLEETIEREAEVYALGDNLSDWNQSLTYEEVLEVIQSGKHEEPFADVLLYDAHDNRPWQDVVDVIEVTKAGYIQFAHRAIELSKTIQEDK